MYLRKLSYIEDPESGQKVGGVCWLWHGLKEEEKCLKAVLYTHNGSDSAPARMNTTTSLAFKRIRLQLDTLCQKKMARGRLW